MEISGEQLTKMSDFQSLVLETNKHMNLTAIKTDEDFAVKHFIDSMTVLPYLRECTSVCDIGSGAGFPGIVLAIMREDIQFTLLDSQRKRVHFLERVVKSLALSNVKCFHKRAEEMTGHFDVVTARAVAALDKLVRWGLPLVSAGGLMLAMKGPGISDELDTAKPVIKKHRGEIVRIDRIEIHPGVERSIVVIRR